MTLALYNKFLINLERQTLIAIYVANYKNCDSIDGELKVFHIRITLIINN